MIKKKLYKLITTGLIATMLMGSVGTTVSAAEADTASTEIIMLSEDEESGREDSRALEVLQETGQDPPAAASEAEAALTDDDSEENTVNTDPAAGEETDGEQPDLLTEGAEPQTEAAELQKEEETADEETATDTAAGEGLLPDEGDTPLPQEEEDPAFTVTGLELSTTELRVDEKTTSEITVTAAVETANTENIAERVAGTFTWESSDNTVAVITGEPVAVVVAAGGDEPVEGQDSSDADPVDAGETAEPVQCTVTLTMTVSALKEGTADLSVSVGDRTEVIHVCVDPVPVALEKCTNLVWKSVTVLYWNAVKGASSYRITTYLINGGKTYSKTISVNVTHYDLEDEIIALIKANKASLKGASYSIRAAVWAKPSDTVHFRMGPGAKSDTIRYQTST